MGDKEIINQSWMFEDVDPVSGLFEEEEIAEETLD